MPKEFIIGNEVIVRAALEAGAMVMCGYPITPSTEIMSYWTKICGNQQDIKFIQTEDEMAAGFAMIGAILAGKISFTATAGPGNVLMQDAFSMAEAMRIPTVAFIMQRGGPSTGTVIYSQQEVILTCHGGNGEGMRIVYSPSSLQELYDLSLQAFNVAWKYRFPTFILGDGYLGKMQGEVNIKKNQKKENNNIVKPFLLKNKDLNNIKKMLPVGSFLISKRSGKDFICLRNCYNMEEELNLANEFSKKYFDKISPKVTKCEIFNSQSPKILVIAHGMVGAAAKAAIMNSKNKKVCLFRPISLNPFPQKELLELAKKAKKIIVFESAYNQLGILVKDAIYGLSTKIETYFKSGLGFTPEEIYGKF